MKKTMTMKIKTTKALLLAGILVPAGMAVSCADDITDGGGRSGDRGAAVTFSVSDAQDDAQKAAGSTRAIDGTVTRAAFADGLAMQGLAPEDLTTQKIDAQGGGGLCLIGTTVAGSNPVKRDGARTRAEITTTATLGGFSTTGYRGTSAVSIAATPWFHNRKTGRDGTLAEPEYWSSAQPWGRFCAVSPQVTAAYTKLTVSPDTHEGTPYVDFEVEPDAENQKDLMTACSGTVHYGGGAEAPAVPMRFRHALTAVRFKVGGNLSWNKTITKVEIVGARSKGRYTLPSDEKGTGAGWSGLSAPATFTLGGNGNLKVSTSAAVNAVIVGNAGDNHTFYMIPQPLDGVTVRIHWGDNTSDEFPLKGTWKPGTTKTYALSENPSAWDYVLTVTDPDTTAYDKDTPATGYTVQSYRTDPGTGTQQPVAWKVTGYDSNGDGKFSMDEKPAWLTSLSSTEGSGGTAADPGMPKLRIDDVDLLAARNNALRRAAPRGSAGNGYDLSTKGGSVARSTANSYVISAPGHYRIPLVYGNAITDGKDNPPSYKTSHTGRYILSNFKDHDGQDITDPWITRSNRGDNVPDGARLVWADEKGLVTGLAVSGSGTGAFLDFEVPASAIRNGNAVIAATKGGTVVWSWHLWFAPEDVLGTVPCTNQTNHIYNFTDEPLGWKYTVWHRTIHYAPRSVKVRVEQTVGNNGKQTGVITVTQANGGERKGYCTLYQWGRKDAMPGTAAIAEGTFTAASGDKSLRNDIQHPEIFYTDSDGGSTRWDRWEGDLYDNFWSMENTEYVTTNDDQIVKTVYDPCPAGFKMPPGNAFTGFTMGGGSTKDGDKMNVSGGWDNGWHFNNRIDGPNATVYFPRTGYRKSFTGEMRALARCYCWTATPRNDHGFCFEMTKENVIPTVYYLASHGLAVRPVAE